MTYFKRMVVTMTAVTALTAQTLNFGGTVEYVRLKNNSPNIVSVLNETGEAVKEVIWPGDFEEFGEEIGNSMRIYVDVASTAADIAAGNLLFVKYVLKRRG